MRLILPVCAFLMLAGCATGPSTETKMASFIGATPQTLVQALGVPDKQITLNGVEYLAYVKHDVVVTPGIQLGPWWGGSTPPQVDQFDCQTTFTVQNGHVTNFTLRGNDCN